MQKKPGNRTTGTRRIPLLSRRYVSVCPARRGKMSSSCFSWHVFYLFYREKSPYFSSNLIQYWDLPTDWESQFRQLLLRNIPPYGLSVFKLDVHGERSFKNRVPGVLKNLDSLIVWTLCHSCLVWSLFKQTQAHKPEKNENASSMTGRPAFPVRTRRFRWYFHFFWTSLKQREGEGNAMLRKPCWVQLKLYRVSKYWTSYAERRGTQLTQGANYKGGFLLQFTAILAGIKWISLL